MKNTLVVLTFQFSIFFPPPKKKNPSSYPIFHLKLIHSRVAGGTTFPTPVEDTTLVIVHCVYVGMEC